MDGLNEPEPINWLSMAGAVFTLVNSALSASLLTLPFAFKKAGILLTLVMIVLCALLARFIDWRLVRYGRRFKAPSYARMIASSLGDRVGIFLSALVAISLFAGLVGLLILVGDLVTPIMQHWFGTASMLGNRTALTLIISVIFIIPLGSLPSVSMLQYSSFLTVISMVFMAIVVIVRSSQHVGDVVGTEESHHPVLWNWSWEALRALPIVWYNSGFIFQAIPVLSQNERQFTNKRTMGIMAVVTSIVAGLMLALGLPGYMTFYDRTNGNLLTNYAIDDPLIGVCRALVTVVVVCSYPLFNLPLRESVFYLLGQIKAFQERQSAASALALPATELSTVSSLSSLSSSTDSDSSKSAMSGFASPTSHDELLHSEFETASEDNLHLPHSDSVVELDLDGPQIHEIPDDSAGPIKIPEASPVPRQADAQIEFQSQSLFAVYSRTVIQTIIAWALAFTLAYVIPDITIVISFVASTFSPVYYFCLPAFVALSLPDKTNRTKIGAYVLFACCALFLVDGWGTYFLPKNVVSPALPSYNSTSTA